MDDARPRSIIGTSTPARGPAPEASELYALAVQRAGSREAAELWFSEPTALLGGDTPQQRLNAGDTQSVYCLLGGYQQSDALISAAQRAVSENWSVRWFGYAMDRLDGDT